ncbi:L-ectoine synthase [Salinisphaera dokdonensis CL-ES53]|uniref:L-ectoine synthase n=1 Tax=Salinisphaera dokdonensis CL-ES53 TaxID=1304272 RepID=A0ABV2AW49_9GAMM
MKIVRTEDLRGTDREVISKDGWTSVRWLLKSDNMGFSFHETTFPPGLEFDMWYKHHLEAVFCYQGEGTLVNRDTGEEHKIEPGTVYALDNHDRHTLKAKTELKLVCAFNPPVTGRETHDADGAYVPPKD